ncbi:hypothetical protein [Amaricoccus sp.]|uniref:alpha/beta hydrolase family protein n=1 Tax=Amaricoccus sp. TaxID=1872485 RepID=UPI001B4D050A|nr:hypothetical protein [Amaricoccus sp.]MBP7002425.1 hypothetical protein [Amaricoccus sp.]
MARFFQHPGFDFETRIALGAVAYRCAEAGEVLATADTVKDGDFDSWFDAWTATAERVAAIAAGAEAAGHKASALEAWLRASKYHGMAFFFVLGTRDPSRGPASWRAHRTAFDRAIALWPTPARKVAIPYEGGALKGYWLDPAAAPGPRPLAILNNGSDGTATDMLVAGGVAALERGWSALIFDGPGQGAALYEDKLHFRPDWEAVISPVLDFALADPGVDPARVALLGVSQAGYWVPRAAAFEPRLAAIVADPGVTRVWASWYANLPPEMVGFLDKGDRASFDAWMAEGARETPPALAFEIAKRSEPYGIADVFDLFTAVRGYDLAGVADRIRCPVLIASPDDEQFWPGQGEELLAMLTCPKTLVPFTTAEGGAGHCEPLAPTLRNQRVFDWLAATLG